MALCTLLKWQEVYSFIFSFTVYIIQIGNVWRNYFLLGTEIWMLENSMLIVQFRYHSCLLSGQQLFPLHYRTGSYRLCASWNTTTLWNWSISFTRLARRYGALLFSGEFCILCGTILKSTINKVNMIWEVICHIL